MARSYLTIAVSAALAGLVRQAYRRYDLWRQERNALPDDVRSEIYWNDQRYERLRWWLHWGWPVALVSLIAVTFAYYWLTTPT